MSSEPPKYLCCLCKIFLKVKISKFNLESPSASMTSKYFRSPLLIWGLAYFYPFIAHLLLERERQRDKQRQNRTVRDKK